MEAMKGHKSEKSRRFQIVIMLSVALSIGACTGKSQDTVGSGSGAESQAVSTGKSGVTAEERALYTKEIAAMAEQLDRTYEDGWICGRNTRVHKSGYRDVSPQIKAQFAVAYYQYAKVGVYMCLLLNFQSGGDGFGKYGPVRR